MDGAPTDILSRCPAPRRHRLSRQDYYRLGEAGILTRDDRVELLEGQLVDMSAIGPRHAIVTENLTELLFVCFAGAGRYSLPTAGGAGRRVRAAAGPSAGSASLARLPAHPSRSRRCRSRRFLRGTGWRGAERPRTFGVCRHRPQVKKFAAPSGHSTPAKPGRKSDEVTVWVLNKELMHAALDITRPIPFLLWPHE